MPTPTSIETEYPAINLVVSALGGWVRQRRQNRRDRENRRSLDECGSHEVARIARDVGLSSDDLREMMNLAPDAAKLLLRRMTVLHLDADALAKSEMGVMRDLQRLCSTCGAKKQCQRDLARDPENPVWRQYCPNEGTLVALQGRGAVGR